MWGFKLTYYISSLFVLPQSFRTWALRRRNLKEALEKA